MIGATINTAIDMSTTEGITQLQRIKFQNTSGENEIYCKYHNFSFKIKKSNINLPDNSDSNNNKVIMKINDPTDVLFNDRSINVDKIDSIEIFNNCDCLKFNNFTFNKQPFVSEVINAKTIFDYLVEIGITTTFGYKNFDINKQDTFECNFHCIIIHIAFSKYQTTKTTTLNKCPFKVAIIH